jgi:hypothetical protein
MVATQGETMIRRTHCLRTVFLIAAVAAAPLVAEEPEVAEEPQLVVTRAHADHDNGILVIEGLAFGDGEPSVLLGTEELEIQWADSNRIEAVLPRDLGDGTHLLMVFRGQEVNEYDVFHVAVTTHPEAVSPAAEASGRGERGQPGPTGPSGPVGPQGPAGPSGLSALAGQRCPAGSLLVGFSATGGLECETLAAPQVVEMPSAEAADVLAAPAVGCLEVDTSAPSGDFAAEGGALVLASWPAAPEGLVEGRLQGREDLDRFAIVAREGRFGGLCLSDRADDPLRAALNFRSPGEGTSATLCACWSGAESCDRSRELCVTSVDGAEVSLAIAAAMRCRQRDELVLDVSVRPLSPRLLPSCGAWQVGWSISE